MKIDYILCDVDVASVTFYQKQGFIFDTIYDNVTSESHKVHAGDDFTGLTILMRYTLITKPSISVFNMMRTDY